MKIMLQWGAPEQADMIRFLQTVGGVAQQLPIPEESLQQQTRVIAAFDGRKLVGVGAVHDSGLSKDAGYHIMVHPDYESSGIRQHMSKLLQTVKQTGQSRKLYA